MKLSNFFLFAVFTLALNKHAGASENEDNNLHFDSFTQSRAPLYFSKDDALAPRESDFKLLGVSFLSNEKGDRWALISLENTARGQRILQNKMLLATFADGSQAYASGLNKTLQGSERFSKSVFFGNNQFPIVNITTYLDCCS